MPTEWQPTATRAAIEARAGLYATLRRFFAEREILEVETPLMATTSVTDTAIESLGVVTAFGRRELQTSPEYAMKRLLAAGLPSIYQICKAFRDGELGARHRVEFTLLEWYRLDFDHRQLMQEVADLLALIFNINNPDNWVITRTYSSLFQEHLSIEPLEITARELHQCLQAYGQTVPNEIIGAVDPMLDYAMSFLIEPKLPADRLVFVTEYPASQAVLARLSPENPVVAERFECFYQGLELANGFHELTCVKEQRRRFEQDNQRRAQEGLVPMQLDEQLLAALDAGLPDCAGVALGLDRVLMILLSTTNINDVISF